MKGSKQKLILNLLKLRLLRGVYSGRMPGDRDLAAELGTSTLTLAMAMSHLEAMGLVERRARSGTYALPKEKRPASATAMTVMLSQGVWVHDDPGAWGNRMGYAFEQEAKARGLDMVLTRQAVEDTDAMVEELLTHLKGPSCVGACVYCHPLTVAQALRLADAAGPVVVADWEMSETILPTVNFDNAEAGRLAAGHLLTLGHRRIVFADPLPPIPARAARVAGAADMVRRLGGEFRDVHGPEMAWGIPACLEILRRPDRPSAVICGSTETATNMAAAAAELGLSIPRDLSLVRMGVLKNDTSHDLHTFVPFDHASLGKIALDLLLETEPGMTPRTVLVPVRLIDHGTTAPPAAPK